MTFDRLENRRTAIAYMPTADRIESTARCLEHISYRHYELLGVVLDFAEAEQMIDDHRADICVVDTRLDLPPSWTQRYEVVAEHTRDPGQIHRRTARIIRRGAAT